MNITNEDNMKLMARYEDNHFDLAIVDPPYGIGISKNPVRQQHAKKEWDNEIPTKEYFNELIRVSRNQIIWGGNYFDLPPTQGFFIWDKKQPHDFSLAMTEYAWSSIQKPAKMWTLSVLKERGKIHPTQKPVELYEWLLMNNAKEGDKILDTHIGSQSISLAVHNMNSINKMNLTLVGCELDFDYFTEGNKRYQNHIKQKTIFDTH
jgi:site-specific DNA-methyltransferase (adenine-specific)